MLSFLLSLGHHIEVTLSADELIESPRNMVITGRKLPGFAADCHVAAPSKHAWRSD